MEKFLSTQLLFENPDEVADGIAAWFEANPNILDIHSVSVFTTAKQTATVNLGVAPNNQPQMKFQFRFIVVYSAEFSD